MRRRDVLRALMSLAAGCAFLPTLGQGAEYAPTMPPLPQIPKIPNQKIRNPIEKEHNDHYLDRVPAIPILAFYRVIDTPRFPEDISSAQLAEVFSYAWAQGFRPVSMSDILLNRVDSVVEKGFKPLGITSDGAHPSIIFSSATAPNGSDKGPLTNTQSFMEVFVSSLQQIAQPRGTFFLSIPNGKKGQSYFGSVMPLKEIADVLQIMPNVEFGYQTKWYTGLTSLDAKQVRSTLEMQIKDFQSLGMLDKIPRIISYPYSARPNEQGILALQELQFQGGFLTYPGVGEAHHNIVPHCLYNGKLMTNPFFIPRVAIGSHVYAPGTKPSQNPAINPINDFQKDVLKAIPLPYISKGISL